MFLKPHRVLLGAEKVFLWKEVSSDLCHRIAEDRESLRYGARRHKGLRRVCGASRSIAAALEATYAPHKPSGSHLPLGVPG